MRKQDLEWLGPQEQLALTDDDDGLAAQQREPVGRCSQRRAGNKSEQTAAVGHRQGEHFGGHGGPPAGRRRTDDNSAVRRLGRCHDGPHRLR